MNFADSLRNYNPEEEKTKRIQAGKERAIRLMVQTTRQAIEFSARKASLCGEHKISGYVTVKNDYDTDPVFSLAEQWGYDIPEKQIQNVAIYQIDTMTEYSFIPYRTTRNYVSSGASSASANTYKLTKDDMDTLCNEVATMIASMGFYDYKVEAVPMHFYSVLHEQRTGFFGSKWINKKIDDGIGHVLKVTVSW